MGVVPAGADPATTTSAIAAAGFRLDQVVEIGSEWGKIRRNIRAKPGRELLQSARLRRQGKTFTERYGRDAYAMMLGDGRWHVYAMIG